MAKRQDSPLTKAKKDLSRIFSTYIRTRDCLATTGMLDEGLCCTCKRRYPLKKLQAGHFIPGRMDSILFEPTCVHAQCYRCNMRRQGEWVKYYRFMQKKYGNDEIERLMKLSEKNCSITIGWIESTKTYYLTKIDELKENYV